MAKQEMAKRLFNVHLDVITICDKFIALFRFFSIFFQKPAGNPYNSSELSLKLKAQSTHCWTMLNSCYTEPQYFWLADLVTFSRSSSGSVLANSGLRQGCHRDCRDRSVPRLFIFHDQWILSVPVCWNRPFLDGHASLNGIWVKLSIFLTANADRRPWDSHWLTKGGGREEGGGTLS